VGPTGRHRIVQLHPTRRCNLRCLHCYSDSGPDVREELRPELVCRLLEDAAGEGYTVAGFSGGEPLLYGALATALDHAHECGLVTTVTTNGMPLTEARVAQLRGRADLLAISLDGVPASHNRMRAHRRAFDVMAGRLEFVRRSEIPFGFIFTLTQHNLDELDWVATFAHEQGARLLQIHPLEEVGRARELLPGQQPDAIESTFAQLEAVRLRERFGDALLVQVDIADAACIRKNPDRVFASSPAASGAPLAELLSPLVVETDGTVVPLQHGFSRRYALGNLHEARLPELAHAWRRDSLGAFHQLCRRVVEEHDASDGERFFNWYERVATVADESSSVTSAFARAP
jgi:MoaA/NifB/PqqE/SkfB family radical SAM enzyme